MDRLCRNCAYYKVKETLISRPIISIKSILDKMLRRKKEMQFKDSIEILYLCGRFGDSGMLINAARGFMSHSIHVPYFEEFHKGPCGLEGKFWEPAVKEEIEKEK